MSDTQVVEAPAAESAEVKPARAVKVAGPCACSTYFVRTDKGIVRTECTGQTVRDFVPGHDAKLKSMLIKAAIGGDEVVRVDPNGTETDMTAEEAAGDFGFASHIAKGVETHNKREAAKAEKKAARDAKKAEADAKRAEEKAVKDAAAAEKKAAAAAKREAAKVEREEKAAARKAEREAKAALAADEKARKAAEKEAAKAAKDAADAVADADDAESSLPA